MKAIIIGYILPKKQSDSFTFFKSIYKEINVYTGYLGV